MLAIVTAYIAGSFSNLMDYIQALASFFNAPLFAIFIFGLFWKRMTGTAGWTGLLAGVAAAVSSTCWSAPSVIDVSSQAGSFLGASAAFVVGVIVAVVVSQFTPGKTGRGAVRAHLGDVEREQRGRGAVAAEDTGWYKTPVIMGTHRAHPHSGPLHHLVVTGPGLADRRRRHPCEHTSPTPTTCRITAPPRRRPAQRRHLFDLRSVIGLLFVVYGVVLTIMGLFFESPVDLAKAGGIDLNLWSGLIMLVAGIIFWVACGRSMKHAALPRRCTLDPPLASRSHGGRAVVTPDGPRLSRLHPGGWGSRG